MNNSLQQVRCFPRACVCIGVGKEKQLNFLLLPEPHQRGNPQWKQPYRHEDVAALPPEPQGSHSQLPPEAQLPNPTFRNSSRAGPWEPSEPAASTRHWVALLHQENKFSGANIDEAGAEQGVRVEQCAGWAGAWVTPS